MKIPLKNAIIVSLIMLAGLAAVFYGSHTEEIHPNQPLSAFPRQIGEWKGKESRFDQAVYDILGVDDSFLATYTAEDGRQVQLYIGFYQSQRKGDLIHSPKNCMPGSGWNITRSSFTELNSGSGKKEKVIKMRLENGPYSQLMLYWFQSRGRIISSEYMQKIYLVTDSIFRHRTDGSFVRLLTPVNQKNEKSALKNITEFAEALLPILNDYIPD